MMTANVKLPLMKRQPGQRVGIYVRLSVDRGDSTSTTRQETDCRKLAEDRGWDVVDVYADTDSSAWDRHVRRAEYERMLDDVAGGKLDGILVWKLDRLMRQRREMVRVDDLLEDHGAFLESLNDPVDSSPMGKTVLHLLASLAQSASDDTSLRTRRAKEDGAKLGRPNGGGRRPFGYLQGGLVLAPAEAQHVTEAAEAVLQGRPLRAIVRDWNSRGIVTPTGRSWDPTPLRRLLQSPRIAGLRSHHKVTVGPAAWPAIVSVADHERLVAILSDPARRTSSPVPRRYYLTGLALCGLCRTPLVAAPTTRHAARTYTCRSAPPSHGCGGVRVVADPLEELVRDAIIAAAGTDGLARALHVEVDRDAEAELLRQVREDEAALEDLARDRYVRRSITEAEHSAARGELEARIRSTRRQLVDSVPAGPLLDVAAGAEALAAAWERGDVMWRTSVARLLLESVVVNRPPQRLNRFQAERVELVWRV